MGKQEKFKKSFERYKRDRQKRNCFGCKEKKILAKTTKFSSKNVKNF